MDGRETPALQQLSHTPDQDTNPVFALVRVNEDWVITFIKKNFKGGGYGNRVVVQVGLADIGDALMEDTNVVAGTPLDVFLCVFLVRLSGALASQAWES